MVSPTGARPSLPEAPPGEARRRAPTMGRATSRKEARADDPELRQPGEPRRPVEDGEPTRLDPLEGRPVEPGEGSYAGGAAGVEEVEEGQALVQVAAGTGGLVGHQRLPCGGETGVGDVLLGDAEGGQLV